MERWVKITESNFQLFQTNEDFVVWISLLRLCDTEGLIDTSLSKVSTMARLPIEEVRKSLTHLFNQGLISRSSSGGTILIQLQVDKKKWVGGDAPRKPTEKVEQLSEVEQQFRNRLTEKFDRIAAMPRPLLLSEYAEINKLYTREQILEVMLAMQNYNELKKYTSAKLTLLNWLKRRYGEN